MSMCHGIGYSDAVTKSVFYCETIGRNQPVETLTLDQLHHDERLWTGLANLMDRADVGMVQRRGGARLLQQLLPCIGIGKRAGVQDFYCDSAIEAWIVRAIHLSHPTCADSSVDAVGAQHRAWADIQPCRGQVDEGRIPECAGLAIGGEHGINLSSQRDVVSALFVEVSTAGRHIARAGCVKNR